MKVLLAAAALFLSSTLYAAVKVDHAWVRLLPPNVQATAAYMALKSDIEDKVLSASSDFASKIEIHNTSMHDGMMSMQPVESIHLPANQTVELKPHGTHLMIMGLKDALKENQDVTITLHLEKAGHIQVKASVERR